MVGNLEIAEGEALEPHWGSVGDERLIEGLESPKEGFLLLSPAGSGKGFEDVEAQADSLTYCSHVWREIEVGDKSDPEDHHQVAVTSTGYLTKRRAVGEDRLAKIIHSSAVKEPARQKY
jgi:hypothetical protein